MGTFDLRAQLRFTCLISCIYFVYGHGYGNCNKEVKIAPRGIIKSPGYPGGYHNHTSCIWVIKKESNEIVTISFSDLDIEEDPDGSCGSLPCCTYNWVKIVQGSSQRQFCGQNTKLPEPLILTGKEVWVKFHSSLKIKGGRGFQLNYVVGSCKEGQIKCNSQVECYNIYERCNGNLDCQDFSDELNCGRCSFNHTSCGLTSNYCYNPYTQRCNRVLDCPNGADELNCEPDCHNKILCNSGSGCYSINERCDGVPQCRDDSDEKHCNNELCRSERGGFLCGNGRCIREIWSCDRTNDCGDWTDEINCLKNSVITAAVMGSLICGLLLVVAISCSCKLYALRNVGSNPPARETPLSRLEREFLYREPPPSYAVAVGDSRAYPEVISNPGSRRSHRHGRRSRRQRSQLIVNRPPPIVEESSESLNLGVGSSNHNFVLDIDRRNSNLNIDDFSRRISSTNVTSVDSQCSSVMKEITPQIPNSEDLPNESTTINVENNSILKSDSESSLSEPQSTSDQLPLLTS